MKFYNETFSKIIKGKSIAIVGPAPTLLGKNQGEYIDSFDLVCKPNLSFNPNEDIQKDYGSRNDIFLTCFNKTPIQEIINSSYDFKDAKCIVKGQYQPNIEFYKIMIDFSVCNQIPLIDFSNQVFLDCWKEFGINLTTGLNAIKMILDHESSKIFIAGFSFYDKNLSVYFDEFNDSNLSAEGGFPDNLLRDFNFPELPLQVEVFKKILKENKNIILDEYLERRFRI